MMVHLNDNTTVQLHFAVLRLEGAQQPDRMKEYRKDVRGCEIQQ
jgi:hypothetical protein